MKKILAVIAGCFLILLGVIGVVMPIMPGWVLIFVGLAMIAPAAAHRIRRRIEMRLINSDLMYFNEWAPMGIDAGLTTRHFPLKLQKTMDLSNPLQAERFTVSLNQSKVILGQKVRFDGNFVYLNQVHEDRIAVIDTPLAVGERWKHFEKADAVVTNQPDTTLLVMTADCLSVYFAVAPGLAADDNARATWVGAAHAGWRGTQQRISFKTFQTLLEKSQAKPEEVVVMFGACIGADQYEVGEEFRDHFPGGAITAKNGKLYFDLAKENESQLLAAGVLPRNIIRHSFCTVAENKHFYSYRKEKEAAGRMVSFIRLRG